MINVAIIGSQGVPAAYGGFESLVENLLGDNCPSDIHYTVFCSSRDMEPYEGGEYRGATLRYVPLHANGIQSIPYDILSMLRSLRGYDAILILGVSGCLFLPVIRKMTRARIIVNIDGLEHRRQKWGNMARRILRASEAMAVRYADIVVGDNQGIVDYVRETYGKDAVMIAYGGDQAARNVDGAVASSLLESYGLAERAYALSLCRIEPENNCEMILESFADDRLSLPLVFIGNWHHSAYAQALRSRYSGVSSIRILDAIYDLDKLWVIRSHAALYVHGHSAGGTNPSLVEAMYAGVPIAAYDVNYNRYTTGGHASYFSDCPSLRKIASSPDATQGRALREHAFQQYRWADIARQYAALFR